MNPNMCASSVTEYESTSPRSNVETALEDLWANVERLEKTVHLMGDRLADILQPEEPSDLLCAEADKRLPQSPVVNRITTISGDVRRMERRLDALMSRLDV